MLTRKLIDLIKEMKGYKSNAQMCRELDIAVPTLSQIYSGNRRLSLDILETWLDKADLKAEEIFRGYIDDFNTGTHVPSRADMIHAMRTVVDTCSERGLDLSTDDLATAMAFVLEDLYISRNKGLSAEDINTSLRDSANKIVRLYG